MMPRSRRLGALTPALLALILGVFTIGVSPAAAASRRLSVDLWTDRGEDGVYQPGDRIEISARLSNSAYLLVYEIDAEGYVHVLHPYDRSEAYVEGPTTLRLPNDETDLQLVTEAPAGEGYIVAIASEEAFDRMPWYLRPYDANAEELGYRDDQDSEGDRDQEGVTAEGRIVGDPFVAMERIRREVLADPDDRAAFATSYASYYVHERVKYPRYVCYDCHRPGVWRWWDGFDPYYTSCSVFDLQVNVGWWWGPSYWFGRVPYYVYSYRTDCPPAYRRFGNGHYSSWNGWNTWSNLWGPMRRYKSAPPAGYLPPTKYDVSRRWRETGQDAPPGFLASAHQFRERRGPGFGRGATGLDPGRRDLPGEGRQRRGGFDFVPKDRGDRGGAGAGRSVEPRERRGSGDVPPRDRRGDNGDVQPRERRGGSPSGSGDVAPRERRGGGDAPPRDRRGSDPGSGADRRRDDTPTRREMPGARRGDIPGTGRNDRPGLGRWKAEVPPGDGGSPGRSSFAPRFNQRVEPRFDRPAGPMFPRRDSPRFDRNTDNVYTRHVEPRFDRPAEPGYDRPSAPRFERPADVAPRNEPTPRFEAPRERRESAPAPSAAPPSAPPGRTFWGGHKEKGK